MVVSPEGVRISSQGRRRGAAVVARPGPTGGAGSSQAHDQCMSCRCWSRSRDVEEWGGDRLLPITRPTSSSATSLDATTSAAATAAASTAAATAAATAATAAATATVAGAG